MSRSEILFAILCGARGRECMLFEEMGIALEAVGVHKAAEEVIALIYVPQIETATKISCQAFADWKSSLGLDFNDRRSRLHYFTHPHREDDEIFFGNVTTAGLAGCERYATKRADKGFVDGLGSGLNDNVVFPVFIKIEEAIAKNLFNL
ncbi:MAG: hypothetical protein AAB920_00320 [Patescibacteria group bacterium]